MRASPLRWAVRLALLGGAVMALIALPGGAALHLLVLVVFVGVIFTLDRLVPSSGSVSADADRAFELTQRQRKRGLLGRGARKPEDRLELLASDVETTAARRTLGVEAIELDSILGTVESDRAEAFDRRFSPPAWSEGRWKLMWVASERGASMPPISVYRFGSKHYVRDGHHRVSVARALGAVEIDAEVTELRQGSGGR